MLSCQEQAFSAFSAFPSRLQVRYPKAGLGAVHVVESKALMLLEWTRSLDGRVIQKRELIGMKLLDTHL